MSDNSEMSQTSDESKDPETLGVVISDVNEEIKQKRGRKSKYANDEERKQARREQNRRYRERKRQELIEQRRANAMKSIEEHKSTLKPLSD